MPREVTAFVGRQAELHAVAERLDASPLVTIAGPGGAGKTRLALRIGQQALEHARFTHGVMLVELASLAGEDSVERSVAERLGVPSSRGGPLLDMLVRTLLARHLLLVLDNCEHVLAAAADLAAALVRGCPRLHILATSREPLRVVGEVVYRIPPMAVPSDSELASLEAAEAARLFVLRAHAANSAFELTESNAPAVAEICRRLDGLPLAIELAAARVAAFGPTEIAARLDDTLPLASGGPRDAPPRHQALEATLNWSYRLLDAPERRLFERLSVFAGGFPLPAARAVAPIEGAALEHLARLVAKSMVQLEPRPGGGARYRLLEPLRQFGVAQLVASGELEPARRAHAEWVASLCEDVHREAHLGGRFERWRDLQLESANIRVAIEWALGSQDAGLALRIGAALWLYWTRPDRQSVARDWLERILALPAAHRPDVTPLRLSVMVGLADVEQLHGDSAAALRLLDAAQPDIDAHGDDQLQGIAMLVRGSVMAASGHPAAETLLDSAAASGARTGLHWIDARRARHLADVALERGDLAAAEAALRRGLQPIGRGRDPWTTAILLNTLGDVMRARGDAAQAGALYAEAISHFQALDPDGRYFPHGILHNLAYVQLADGQLDRATDLFLEGADTYVAVGSDRRGLAECVIGLGCTAARASHGTLAANLFGSAEAELERMGTSVSPTNRADYERGMRALRASLPSSQVAAELASGRKLALEAALELARTALRARPSGLARTPSTSVASVLTQREYEVAQLVSRGLTNRQVAAELVVAEKTVKNHVQRVLEKLGVRSRAELAARAAAMGIHTDQ